MRSILFVPASRADLIEKAAHASAAAVCLDLEDGVAPGEKTAARAGLGAAVSTLTGAGRTVLLRINADLGQISHDLASCPDGLSHIVLPMAGSRHQIRQLADWTAARFGGEAPKIVAMIETAAGLRSIASGMDPLPSGLTHLALGPEDLSADLGCSPDAAPVAAAFHTLVHLAAEWRLGLLGFPGSIAEFSDLDAFARSAALGRAAGATGAFAIHPRQVEVLNRVFAPTEAELARARRVVEVFEEGVVRGLGAVALDGRMIDRPVYLAALGVLSRAAAPRPV